MVQKFLFWPQKYPVHHNDNVHSQQIYLLEKQEVLFGNKSINFEIDQFKKKCLTEGLDDIALSMEKINHINKFEKKINLSKPWVFNNG